MTTKSINIADAKEEFSELLNRVSHNKERIIITRRDKEVAAIISMDDLRILQASETKTDLDDAMDALKEARQQGCLSLDELKNNIG